MFRSPLMVRIPGEVPGRSVPLLVSPATGAMMLPLPWMMPVVLLMKVAPVTWKLVPAATSIRPSLLNGLVICRVPVARFTVPVLLNSGWMRVALAVPAVFCTTPALLKVSVAPPVRSNSVWMSKMAPAWLVIRAPPDMLMFLPAKLSVPWLIRWVLARAKLPTTEVTLMAPPLCRVTVPVVLICETSNSPPWTALKGPVTTTLAVPVRLPAPVKLRLGRVMSVSMFRVPSMVTAPPTLFSTGAFKTPLLISVRVSTMVLAAGRFRVPVSTVRVLTFTVSAMLCVPEPAVRSPVKPKAPFSVPAPLMTRLPLPVTLVVASAVCVPLRFRVVPGPTVKPALVSWVPPPVSCNSPACTSTSAPAPLLLKTALMKVGLAVPAVFCTTPALLKVSVAPPVRSNSVWMSKMAPAWLVIRAPPDMLMFLPAKLSVPWLIRWVLARAKLPTTEVTLMAPPLCRVTVPVVLICETSNSPPWTALKGPVTTTLAVPVRLPADMNVNP